MKIIHLLISLVVITLVHQTTRVDAQNTLRVVGQNRTQHSIEPSLRYKTPHSADLSARYQWFVQNRTANPVSATAAKNLTVNGKSPSTWHSEGKISWFGTPDNDPTFPGKIPPGALMVWQLNGKNHQWVTGNQIRLQTAALDTTMTDAAQQLFISMVTFTGSEASSYPNQIHIHLANDSERGATIAGVRLWLPGNGDVWPFLYAGEWHQPSFTLPENAMLPARSRSLMRVETNLLPLAPVAVEVKLNIGDSQTMSLWASLKVRKETFDISAGWANDRIGGKPSFLNETFLQTMASLYINTAHYQGQPGYSDNPALFNRYPLKYFHRLSPGPPFDTDSMLTRIHAVEFLGEPQYGGGTPVDPQKIYDQLLPYHTSRLSTTITHSEERIWRYYAGLSDYPHYDAYRVSAPSPDDWKKYDRWSGRRIGWGSPLESIGTMTRSLRSLNRPKPVAYWSQGAHSGWEVYDGRKRTSPTPAELRAQAYHALASGITSLYWFNLSYSSLKSYPDLLQPIQEIGRGMRLLDDFYIKSDLWHNQVISNWDISTLVSENGVLLFAIELAYHADHKSRTFVYPESRHASIRFKVPEWTNQSWSLCKLKPDGLVVRNFEIPEPGSLHISDDISEAGIYVLLKDRRQYDELNEKFHKLILGERQLLFNPAQKPDDLQKLLRLDNK